MLCGLAEISKREGGKESPVVHRIPRATKTTVGGQRTYPERHATDALTRRQEGVNDKARVRDEPGRVAGMPLRQGRWQGLGGHGQNQSIKTLGNTESLAVHR